MIFIPLGYHSVISPLTLKALCHTQRKRGFQQFLHCYPPHFSKVTVYSDDSKTAVDHPCSDTGMATQTK